MHVFSSISSTYSKKQFALFNFSHGSLYPSWWSAVLSVRPPTIFCWPHSPSQWGLAGYYQLRLPLLTPALTCGPVQQPLQRAAAAAHGGQVVQAQPPHLRRYKLETAQAGLDPDQQRLPVAGILCELGQHPAPVASLHHLNQLLLPVPGGDPVHSLRGHHTMLLFSKDWLLSPLFIDFTSLLDSLNLNKVSPESVTCLAHLKGFVPDFRVLMLQILWSCFTISSHLWDLIPLHIHGDVAMTMLKDGLSHLTSHSQSHGVTAFSGQCMSFTLTVESAVPQKICFLSKLSHNTSARLDERDEPWLSWHWDY